jgi:hypothetical protein
MMKIWDEISRRDAETQRKIIHIGVDLKRLRNLYSSDEQVHGMSKKKKRTRKKQKEKQDKRSQAGA